MHSRQYRRTFTKIIMTANSIFVVAWGPAEKGDEKSEACQVVHAGVEFLQRLWKVLTPTAFVARAGGVGFG